MTGASEHFVFVGIRFEKAVVGYLRAVDTKDVALIMVSITAYAQALQDVDDLPTAADRVALAEFVRSRGKVPEDISEHIIATLEQIEKQFDGPMPSALKN